MNSRLKFTLRSALCVPLCFSILFARPDTTKQQNKDEEEESEVVVLSPFTVSSPGLGGYLAGSTLSGARLGATVGGAKDVRYFRDIVAQGGFPHPNTFTPEGLFSEHDLPLKNRTDGDGLLVINGEAIRASLIGEPAARYLAQIGFSSGLSAKDWRRAPLNLVAVVDKSGSMDGAPLALVRDCLRQIVSQLGSEDQLSIVLYGDRSHVHLEPTRATAEAREEILQAIEEIRSSGSTNMEAGLKVGFQVARQSKRNFSGITRVMQFTDERPNTGDTRPGSFMGMMESASRDGIGQTTIGVGVQFGAELATKISSVRGGNLFFFPNPAEMVKTFREEFDTLVTELAYDMDVTVKAAPGLRIVGVYGLPGEMLTWNGKDEVNFRVTTLFLSKRKGAIYVALAPKRFRGSEAVEGGTLAQAKLSYTAIGDEDLTTSTVKIPLVDIARCSQGLQRGQYLVSEYLGLREAMTAHLVKNDQDRAFHLLSDLRELFTRADDTTLTREADLVKTLHGRMAKLAGRSAGATCENPSEEVRDR
jgi:Ca-activated chloride channel homolog